jgi:hypothetical protein
MIIPNPKCCSSADSLCPSCRAMASARPRRKRRRKRLPVLPLPGAMMANCEDDEHLSHPAMPTPRLIANQRTPKVERNQDEHEADYADWILQAHHHAAN